MHILYVAVAPFTYGELGLLLNFHRGLEPGHTQPLFLVGENHEPLVRSQGLPTISLSSGDGDANRRRLVRALAQAPPNLIIVPDYLSLWYTGPYYGLGMDFWRALSVPLVSLDSHGWSRWGYTMDIGGVEVDPTAPEGEHLARARDDFAAIVRLYPLNNLDQRDENELAMAMRRPPPIELAQREDLRQQVGCGQGDKLLFLVGLMYPDARQASRYGALFAGQFPDLWAMIGIMSAVGQMTDAVRNLLSRYLGALGAGVHVVSVSHMSALAGLELGDTHLVQLPMLDEAQYDQWIQSADLVVTLNEISGTLVKAAYAGIPALALVNSLDLGPGGQRSIMPFEPTPAAEALLGHMRRVYPWRYFPVGLYRCYEPLLSDNPYGQTYLRQEIFDEAGCRSLLAGALYDDGVASALRAQQAGYVQRLDRLDGPAEVLVRLAERLGMRGDG